MDWSSSNTYFGPPYGPEKEPWSIAHPNNPRTSLPEENFPFTLGSTQLLGERLDEKFAIDPMNVDSASGILSHTNWISDNTTAHLSNSLVGSIAEHAPLQTAASGKASTETTTTTHVESEADMRNTHEGLGQTSSTSSQNEETSTNSLRCPWEGCKWPGRFSRKSVLKRHMMTQHENPRSFKCPHEGCNKLCNRSDNMKEHVLTVHGTAY